MGLAGGPVQHPEVAALHAGLFIGGQLEAGGAGVRVQARLHVIDDLDALTLGKYRAPLPVLVDDAVLVAGADSFLGPLVGSAVFLTGSPVNTDHSALGHADRQVLIFSPVSALWELACPILVIHVPLAFAVVFIFLV